MLVTSESHKVGLASSSGAGARERSMEGGGLLAMRKALGGPLEKPQVSRSPHPSNDVARGKKKNKKKPLGEKGKKPPIRNANTPPRGRLRNLY